MLEFIAIGISLVSVFYAFLVWRSLRNIEIAVKRAFGEKALMLHSSRKAEKYQKQFLEQMLPQILSQVHPLGGLLSPFVRSFLENTDLKPSDVLGLVQAIQNIFSSFGKQSNLNKESSESKNLKDILGGEYGSEEKE